MSDSESVTRRPRPSRAPRQPRAGAKIRERGSDRLPPVPVLTAGGRSDARLATWEISRTIDCTVDALDDAQFQYGYAHVPLRTTTLATFAFSLARLRLGARPRPAAIIPLQGSFAIRFGRTVATLEADSSAALVPAGHQVELELAGAHRLFLLCEFEPEQFIRSNGNVLGRLDSAFVRESLLRSRPFVVGPDARDPFGVRILNRLIEAIDAFAPEGAPPIFPELEDCLLKALYLVTFARRNNGTRPAPPDQPVDPRLRRLCAKVLDNLSSELKLSEMAQECDLSVRTIQYLFQRHFAMTPKQWIIEQRLLAVRARLSHPSERDSVTSIAIPFFNNLGDFARRYRRRFGEKPSDTLARSRHRA